MNESFINTKVNMHCNYVLNIAKLANNSIAKSQQL